MFSAQAHSLTADEILVELEHGFSEINGDCSFSDNSHNDPGYVTKICIHDSIYNHTIHIICICWKHSFLSYFVENILFFLITTYTLVSCVVDTVVSKPCKYSNKWYILSKLDLTIWKFSIFYGQGNVICVILWNTWEILWVILWNT